MARSKQPPQTLITFLLIREGIKKIVENSTKGPTPPLPPLTGKQVWLWPQKAPGMCGLEPL